MNDTSTPTQKDSTSPQTADANQEKTGADSTLAIWGCPQGGTPTMIGSSCRCIKIVSGDRRDLGPCVWSSN